LTVSEGAYAVDAKRRLIAPGANDASSIFATGTAGTGAILVQISDRARLARARHRRVRDALKLLLHCHMARMRAARAGANSLIRRSRGPLSVTASAPGLRAYILLGFLGRQ